MTVYWADVDISIKGKIYFRVEIDAGPGMDTAKATVVNHYNNGFDPNIAIIATWVNVTYSGGSTTSPVDPYIIFHSFNISHKATKNLRKIHFKL